MARKFKYLPSVHKGYAEQGMIFFACQNYARQTAEVQSKIDRLCREAGGEYADALRAYALKLESAGSMSLSSGNSLWMYAPNTVQITGSTIKMYGTVYVNDKVIS